MTLAVPKDQYRKSYLFHAPSTYSSNYVNITAPTGVAVTLDGASVSGFSPIGGTGFSVARVALANANGGSHTISSSSAFGISVYGYYTYTSYWYPGARISRGFTSDGGLFHGWLARQFAFAVGCDHRCRGSLPLCITGTPGPHG